MRWRIRGLVGTDRLALGAVVNGTDVAGADRYRGDARGAIGADLAVGRQVTETV